MASLGALGTLEKAWAITLRAPSGRPSWTWKEIRDVPSHDEQDHYWNRRWKGEDTHSLHQGSNGGWKLHQDLLCGKLCRPLKHRVQVMLCHSHYWNSLQMLRMPRLQSLLELWIQYSASSQPPQNEVYCSRRRSMPTTIQVLEGLLETWSPSWTSWALQTSWPQIALH